MPYQCIAFEVKKPKLEFRVELLKNLANNLFTLLLMVD